MTELMLPKQAAWSRLAKKCLSILLVKYKAIYEPNLWYIYIMVDKQCKTSLIYNSRTDKDRYHRHFSHSIILSPYGDDNATVSFC